MATKYYKTIDGEWISYISTGTGQHEITELKYKEILGAIRNAPTPPEGYAYMLRDADLTWELVELPLIPDEPTIEDKAEAYDILMGANK